jgi:putative ABC transport system permease protein
MRRRGIQGRALGRLLRALVRLLPAEFRYDFGGAIEADVTERHRSGDHAGVWWRDIPSLAAAVGREHTDACRQDVTYALRSMRRTPGFTGIAVLMLALGTGVSIAMFSIVDAVLLNSPFGSPDRIVAVLDAEDRQMPTAAVPMDKYLALESGWGSFEAVAGFTGGGTHVTGSSGDLRRLDAECVSASMFHVLGTAPILGRRFDATDDRPGAPPVMVLSYPFWLRLGGSPSIVGSTLVVNRTPVTVIGVMPRFFAGPLSRSDTDAWLPMRRSLPGGGLPGCPSPAGNVSVYARLAPGVSIEQAGTPLGSLVLRHLDDYRFADIRQQFVTLGGAVACVLLIACFNVGGLQMERTLGRRRELAVRVALGASRGRLVRQVLTENLVLALAGGAGGVVAAWWALRAIVSLMPGSIPHLEEIDVNVRILSAALVAAATAGVISGVLPLCQTRRLDPARDLAAGGRSDGRDGWTRRCLVVTEVALSVLVLIGAALMIQTFLTLRPTQPGFDPRHKVSTRVTLLTDPPEARRQFVATLFDELRTMPGVRRAAATTYLPLSGSVWIDRIEFAGGTAQIPIGHVTPEFFELMRIPLRAGRLFTGGDTEASMPVVIVDEVLARQVAPGGPVLGRSITVPPGSRSGDPPVAREIVGVVGSTRYAGRHLRERGTAWVPYGQDPVRFAIVIAESDGRPEMALADGVQRAIRRLKPEVAPNDSVSVSAVVDRSVSNWRFGAWLFGVFGVFSLVLAAIGLMTTIGWWVRQRTRELGVRVALGATTWTIVRLVGWQGLALAASGTALGCAVAAGTTRYLQEWLYGVTPLDKPTFAFVAAAMLVVAVLALLAPVRRATTVDPVVALRAE